MRYRWTWLEQLRTLATRHHRASGTASAPARNAAAHGGLIEAVSRHNPALPAKGRDQGNALPLRVGCSSIPADFGVATADFRRDKRVHQSADQVSWPSGLDKITNNQAGNVVLDVNGDRMHVYVENEAYAESRNPGDTTRAFLGYRTLGYLEAIHA